MIEAYKPEIILIEGPSNAQDLIEDIGKESNKPPFCLYLSYDDQKGLLGKERDKYRAYYPLLSYSPEFQAIVQAKKYGIACQFIDLPYHEKLYNRGTLQEGKDEVEEKDKLFTLNDYYTRLMEKMQCRNFNELWEKLFELPAYTQSTEVFVEGVFTYCYYSRMMTSQEELLRLGDLSRETYMKQCIQQAIENYHKILVVTGGMHTVALASCVYGQQQEQIVESVKKMQVSEPKVYLMPYSFEESDGNKGYEAGMAFPYFYQKIWEAMQKHKKVPYEEVLLSFITNLAKHMRKKQAISITDEMQSFYMAKGLAELRNKANSGVFELIDAVGASFVKGQKNAYHEPILAYLYQLLTGMEMGSVQDTQNMPPIVIDFLSQCKGFRVSLQVASTKEVKLDVATKDEHRRKSQFFYQMRYLDTSFCTYEKGQDERVGIGRILLRETWRYRHTSKVQAVLIDQSIYGGTVKEACYELLKREIKNTYQTAESVSNHLLQAEKMGLDTLYSELSSQLMSTLTHDMQFLSVATCFQNLGEILERIRARGIKDVEAIKMLQAYNLKRIGQLLKSVKQIPREQEEATCKQLKSIYEYLLEEPNRFKEIEEDWLIKVASLFEDIKTNSSVVGTCAGILLKKERINIACVIDKISWYLGGSQEAKKQAAGFLKGFFKVAKDTLFIEPKLLEMIDGLLRVTEGEAFLELLPDLRLAFTYFLPFEIDKIASQVCGFYKEESVDLLGQCAISLEVLEEAKRIDRASQSACLEWFMK